MDTSRALTAFAALSQETRLDTLRLLVRTPNGLLSGQISDALGVRQNTMSTNLSILAQAGLVHATREGRTMRYRVDFDSLRGLLAFLLEDCCGGRPDQCAPLLDGVLRRPAEATT
jgi:DNA-binding transcriptional ArsR family regulator